MFLPDDKCSGSTFLKHGIVGGSPTSSRDAAPSRQFKGGESHQRSRNLSGLRFALDIAGRVFDLVRWA